MVISNSPADIVNADTINSFSVLESSYYHTSYVLQKCVQQDHKFTRHTCTSTSVKNSEPIKRGLTTSRYLEKKSIVLKHFLYLTIVHI